MWVNETHFTPSETKDGNLCNYLHKADIENYTWLSNNRNFCNLRASTPSGGVGMFIKSVLLENFAIKIVDNEVDDILAVLFEDKDTEYMGSFLCVCTYLPPSNSTWGRDATNFFNHLLQLVYTFNDVDAMFMCGDLNSRIGTMSDCNQDLACIPNKSTT